MIKSALTIMIPVLFAAMGGLMPALAGSLNIALEGMLLMGAFVSLTVYYFSGSVFFAIFSAAAAGIVLSCLHVFASFKLKANIIIAGLALNLISSGLCILLSEKIFNTKGVVTINSEQFTTSNNLAARYLVAALLLLIVMWAIINKTPFGFRLRACNKNRDALTALAIKPQKYQIISMLISGFLCGIGGSFLSLNLGSYVPGMSAGKGWIALVVIFLGMHKPQGLLIAGFIFGLSEAFSNTAQGVFQIPADFVLVFPYVFALIAMIIVSIIHRKANAGS